MSNIELMDTHAHFSMLETTPEETLKLARANNIVKIINIGTCMDDLPQVLEVAEKFYPEVFCTLGVHPHDAKTWNDEVKNFIKDNCAKKEVVALGEMGLDYFYSHSEHAIQQKVFREQIEMAIAADLPIEIHTRDAEKDTIDILKDYQGKVTGLIHCFTGSQWLADEALKVGLNISISGVATFKKAEELRDVVKSLPLDRIHVETDSPFLAPVPHRGQKNTPAYTLHTAELVAELKQISLEDLAVQLKKNTHKLFKKVQW
jgi:TatD DNase family protein